MGVLAAGLSCSLDSLSCYRLLHWISLILAVLLQSALPI